MFFLNQGNVLSWATFFPLIGAGAIVVLARGPLRREAPEEARRRRRALDRARHERALASSRRSPRGGSTTRPTRACSSSQHFVWIRAFNIEYFVGVDGLSISMVLLSGLISFVATIASMPWWSGAKDAEMAGMVEDDHGARRRAPPEALLGADGARLHGHAAAPADRHDGHLRRPGHVPLLRVLGGHAPADVLPHRHVGRAAQGVRGDQVLPLHPRRLGADAPRDHRHLLQQRCRRCSPTARCRAATPSTSSSSGKQGAAGPVPERGAHPRLRSSPSSSSSASSSGSPSRSRCSRSTPGCPTPTSRRRRPSRSSWPACS